jgi:hypothetical protein
MVDAYAQDLGIQPGEPGALRLIRRDLITSDRGERQREEGEHYVLSPITGQGDVLSQVALQGEIRSLLADF